MYYGFIIFSPTHSALIKPPQLTDSRSHTDTQIQAHTVCSLLKHSACRWLSFMSTSPVCNLHEDVDTAESLLGAR